ncbi:MAG: hypothetical protein ACRYFZ_13655 [Janthinobacterium lividum]
MATLTQFISYNLTGLNDNDLLKYAFTLLAGLPTVPQYATVVPTIATATPLVQQYATAVANFAKGGAAERMQRDDLRAKVEELVRTWSDYATDETPDSPLLWAAAHFNLTKADRTPRPALSAPTKFVAADGPTKGSVELRQNAQGGTKAYVYEYALVPTDGSTPQWCYCLGTTAMCVVSGLSSGLQYQFRAAAWNGVSETPYSQVETRYVQ